MAKSELFSALPDIEFAQKDPQIIENEIISQFENNLGRTLADGDPLRVFAASFILALIQQRNLINYAALQNSLAYSTGDNLDHIGALLGVYRLGASHSVCTLQFTLSSTMPYSVIIPAGTRATPGGNIYFSTLEEAEISIGQVSTSITAQCSETGTIGNGYLPGQINKIVDVFPYEMDVVNITVSNGGTDTENDENFRERIQIAPESFTTAGSSKSYEYYARGSHSDIINVAVISPPDTQPGHVEIIPLCTNGEIPSDEIISAVYDACNAEDVRPDTDFLEVKKPEQIFYDLEIFYWIDAKNASSSYSIQQNVERAIEKFILWQRLILGRDINPSQLNKLVLDAGAKRCSIISPDFTVLSKRQLAVLRRKNIYYAGLEEG